MSALVAVAQAAVSKCCWRHGEPSGRRLDAFLQWLEAVDQPVALADAATALSMSAGGLSVSAPRN